MFDTYNNWVYGLYNDINIWMLSNSLNFWTWVIDSIRCYKKWSSVYLFAIDQYVDRFLSWVFFAWYKLKESKQDICKIIIKLLLSNYKNLSNPYIRSVAYVWDESMDIVSLNINLWITITDLFVKSNNLKTCFSSFLRRNDIIYKYKLSSNYSKNIFEQIKMMKKWYDAVLFLWEDKEILEWVAENIFLVKDRIIYTPKLGNIVDWINRKMIIWILKKFWYELKEQKIKKQFFLDSDEAFMCGSATWIRTISQIENFNLPEKRIYFKIIDFFKNDFYELEQIWWLRLVKIN